MRKKENQDIRKLLEEKDICYWEVAEKIGIADCTFSRLLRTPLSEENKKKVVKAVKDIEKDRLKD